MLDSRNFGSLSAGIVAAPETLPMKGGKIVKLRVAANFAGQDQDNPDNKSGYFDVTYFARDGEQNASFVLGQIELGNMKVGSQLMFMYRLQQDRYTNKEGQKTSRTILIAENITYAASSKPDTDATSSVEETVLPDKF